MSLSKTVALAAVVLTSMSTGVSANAAKLSQKAIVQQYELTQKNKALVVKAYQELFGDHDLTALDRYWAENYIQHNPGMTDGRDSVKQLLDTLGISHWPKQKVDFKRVIAEGNLVMLQIVQPKTGNAPKTVVVDIFRVENNRIVEHWDVIQSVPSDAVNKRPMY